MKWDEIIPNLKEDISVIRLEIATVNPAIFHTRHETFTHPFHQVCDFKSYSLTRFQVSKWNKQYKWDKNSLDQKNIDFKGITSYFSFWDML